MRLLIFTWRDLSHPFAGGAEVYTQHVARHWVDAGHQVTIFCARPRGLPLEEERDGVRIVRRGSRFTVYREAARFYGEQPPGRYDAVVDEVNTRPFLCPDFVRDAPVVGLVFQLADDVWLHEMTLPVAMLGRHVLEPRWLRRYCAVPMLTISESSRESLQRRGLRDVRLVPVGLEPTPAFDGPREAGPTILFVGRLAPNKRPHHAIEAFRLLRRRLPGVRLWIVGSGPDEGRLRRWAPEGVTFLGRVSNQRKFELMARAHALVATSVREGWGMTVSEAAAMGTRTVAYDVAGLRDSVPAADGELVTPCPSALAARLEEVLPAWQAAPLAKLPTGVVGWGEVADAVVGHVTGAVCG